MGGGRERVLKSYQLTLCHRKGERVEEEGRGGGWEKRGEGGGRREVGERGRGWSMVNHLLCAMVVRTSIPVTTVAGHEVVTRLSPHFRIDARFNLKH